MQLRAIQQELNMTMVLVTHDQEEAMHVSDRIFVMSKGEIAQVGTPLDIYTRPNSEFIANFIGNYNVWTRAELEQILGETLPGKAEKFAVRPEAIQQKSDANSYAFKATAQNTTMTRATSTTSRSWRRSTPTAPATPSSCGSWRNTYII